MSILGLSRWNKNWNVRNSYSYVATANKIWFHFQFPRSPDAEFGGLIGWLFNWKCTFSCRIISKNCKLSQIQLFLRWWWHRKCHVATLKILIFLLKTHCRRRGWWYHVPHSSSHVISSYRISGTTNPLQWSAGKTVPNELLLSHKDNFQLCILITISCIWITDVLVLSNDWSYHSTLSRENLFCRCLFGGESSQYHYSPHNSWWKGTWINFNLQTLNTLCFFYSQYRNSNIWCIDFHKYETYYCLNKELYLLANADFYFFRKGGLPIC